MHLKSQANILALYALWCIKYLLLQRHIGMALVPPVAFTAVPKSPPPTPMKIKKSKIKISPIVPALLGTAFTSKTLNSFILLSVW